MEGSADGSDDCIDRAAPARNDDGIVLEAVVVRYDRRPDRCTLSPGDRTTRTAWLTADVGAFVDLGDAR